MLTNDIAIIHINSCAYTVFHAFIINHCHSESSNLCLYMQYTLILIKVKYLNGHD